MEQRSLRLGDIVDDYCPRERRITNHVVVALIDATIKQTRCTTCDADHPYKDAKVPRRKKTESSAFDQVLADVTGGQPPPPRAENKPEVPAKEAAPASPPAPRPAPAPLRPAPAPAPSPAPAAAAPGAPAPVAAQPATHEPARDAEPADGWGWLAQRRLIRATLPRTESDAPLARPIPEFTMHQPPPSRHGRGGGRYGQQPWHGDGGHRGGRGRGHGHGEVNGNVDREFNGNVGPRHARPSPPVPANGEPAGDGDRPDSQMGGPGGQPGPGQPPGPGRRGRRRRRHRRPRPPQP